MRRNIINCVAIGIAILIGAKVSIASNNEQKQQVNEEVSKQSIQTIKSQLEQDIIELEQDLSLLDKMKNIQIGPGGTGENNTAEDDEKYRRPLMLSKKNDIDKRMYDELHKQISFRQFISSSESTLKVMLAPLKEILSAARFEKYEAPLFYTIKNIQFVDGSQLDASELLSLSNELEPNEKKDRVIIRGNSFTLPVNKPIAKINIDVTYLAYPDFTRVVLNHDNPQFLNGKGIEFKLTNIEGNTASLMITAPKDVEYDVEGINREGKTLDTRGSSSSSFPSDAEIERLRIYHQQLIEVRDNINKFADVRSLEDHLDSLKSVLTDTAKNIPVTNMSVHFYGTPDAVVIYLAEKPEETTITSEIVNMDMEQTLFIAEDTKTKLYGFIDKAGKWQIKPKFEDIILTEIKGLYEFLTETIPLSDNSTGAVYEYYLVDQDGSRYFKAPFENVTKKIDESLLLVQKEINGSYGVYDIKRHQFTIPMEYVSVEIKDNHFIASLGKQTYDFKRKYGVLTLQNKEIIPFMFERVDYDNNFFYTLSSVNEQRDVYNVDGKKLNPDGYQTIGFYYRDQPVVLKNNNTGKYCLLDTKGNILPVKLPFDAVEPFSNGMAIVEMNGLQGAIDVYGEIKIPLKYSSIEAFQENLAAAVPESGRFVLIDRNNKVVKEYAGYLSMTIPRNSNGAVYHVYDDNRNEFLVDADGNIKK